MQNRVVGNLMWRFLERCGAQIVTFIVSIVLARILSPNEYGQIAIITVLITILNVFIDSGFGNALIQKKDSDDTDFSTVFYFNIIVCITLYGMTYFLAPYIAEFYGDRELIGVCRILCLTIIVSGVKNIQQAYVTKHLLFKKFFFSTLSGTIVSAIVGIAMALNGYGVWSLVAQSLSNACIDTIVLWFSVDWRPKKLFSFSRLKELFNYGYKLLISSLLNTVYSNLRDLMIGKIYSSNELAYYNKGKQFPALLITNVNTSIDSVLFPVMSDSQDDNLRLKKMIGKSISISTYILWPLLMGLAITGYPIVEFVLTSKWSSCVPYMQIFCAIYATFPLQTANLNAIKAIGRSDVFLKLEIIESIVGIILLLCGIMFGALAIAIMYLVSSIVNYFLISRESKKLFNYGLLKQIYYIKDNLFITIIMGIMVYIEYLLYPIKWVIFLQIPTGIVIYLGLSYVFKVDSFRFVIELIRNKGKLKTMKKSL